MHSDPGGNMRNIKVLLVLICAASLLAAPAGAKKKQVIRAMGGTIIPGYSMAIDASYDSRLDTMVPGYKMLNVAMMNNSFRIIEMNPQRDQWWIKTKNATKKYKVIGDLRGEDSTAWNGIPENARALISYPLLLPIGARQVVDLFVPDKVPIGDFQELDVYIDSMGVTFEIMARQ